MGQAAGSAAKGVEIYKWVMRIFTPKKLAAFPSLFQANRASGAEADIETTWASQKSQRELAEAISQFSSGLLEDRLGKALASDGAEADPRIGS